MSTELRWRLGAWMVGAGILGILSSLFWIGSTGFAFLCLAGGLLGALIANPFRLIQRLRNHTIVEPVFRLRPLGMIGFVVFILFLLIPYAIGDWLLTIVGEGFERSAPADPAEDDTVDQDPLLEGYDTIFTPAPRRGVFRRFRTRS
jgi:hypothetical protein